MALPLKAKLNVRWANMAKNTDSLGDKAALSVALKASNENKGAKDYYTGESLEDQSAKQNTFFQKEGVNQDINTGANSQLKAKARQAADKTLSSKPASKPASKPVAKETEGSKARAQIERMKNMYNSDPEFKKSSSSPGLKKGGSVKCMASGGLTSRGDGIAQRGKTKCKYR